MVLADVVVLRHVEERWELAEVAGGAHVYRIHEKLHKRVILGRDMSKVNTRQRSKGTPRFGIGRQWVCPKVIMFKGKRRSNALCRVACQQLVNEVASFRAKPHDNLVSQKYKPHF